MNSSATDLYTGLEAINRQHRGFQNWKTTALSSYLEHKNRPASPDTLISLNGIGADLSQNHTTPSPLELIPHLMPEELADISRSGGYWAYLQGASIVINPGKNFLERFHKNDLHLWDIDYVIITDGSVAPSLDLLRIYSLNREVNRLLNQWHLPPHVIKYLLHKEAFKEFSPLLEPSCREERSFVEMLTTFNDQQAFESLQLNNTLSLEYASADQNSSSLMLRFLKNNASPILGFVFQEHIEQQSFLNGCQTVVMRVGKLDSQVLVQNAPSELFGNAQLSILSEFDFSEGDVRIESLAILRKGGNLKKTTLLPSEIGLQINLEEQLILGQGLTEQTPAACVKAHRSNGDFSPLRYIDAQSLL